MGSQIADPTMHVAALQHFEAGRLTEAAATCEVILHRSPPDWLALRLLGHVRNNEHASTRPSGSSPRALGRVRRRMFADQISTWTGLPKSCVGNTNPTAQSIATDAH